MPNPTQLAQLIDQRDALKAEAAKHALPQTIIFRINMLSLVIDDIAGIKKPKPARGGKKTTSGANATGSGPVFEIRQQLKNEDGTTWTQQQLADALGISRGNIAIAERDGDYPKSAPYRKLVLDFAHERNVLPSNII